MTGLPSNIPMQIPSVLKTKGATTAVQSRVPRSAVVATDSRGCTESGRAADVSLTGVAKVGLSTAEKASTATLEGPTTRQAGVAPGPREALSDPVFFNAALHRETV